MHRHFFRRRVDGRRSRATLATLRFESLERRELMAADGLPAVADLGRIMVGYRDQGPAIVHQVKAAEGASLESALAVYRADPNVLFAERDFRVQASAVPNDPYFGNEWGLHNTGQSGGAVDADIDASEAWDLAAGGPRPTVAVIDSGIDYTHPDLYRNIWINQGEIPSTIRNQLVDVDSDSLVSFRDLNDSRNQGQGKITDLNKNGYIDGGDLLFGYRSDGYGGWADGSSGDGDAYVDDLIGWNFVTNTNKPYDDNGHGTHVAGTIGAMSNNGTGVAGVAWESLLVGLKFLDSSGGGYIGAALNAVNYAVAKGIDLSNNSWGGGDYSQAFYDALNNAQAHGHIFVAAAGNGGADGVGDDNDATPSYPANYNLDNVVAVAATDRYDRLAGFSNYGASSVDIAAPGVDILSTLPGGYGYSSGTSMAAPHVAGVIALAQSRNPTETHTQIISRVLNNGDAVSALASKVATGTRLNAQRAVSSGLVADTKGPRVISAAPNATGPNPVSSVRLTFSEAITATSFTVADISEFTGPNGATITPTGVVAVSGSGGTQYDVTFATQSSPGSYRFKVGPAVVNAAGNLMDQDANGVLGEATADQYAAQFSINSRYTYSSSPNAAIRDRYSTVASMTVDRDITIADLNLKLDIAHTYDGDLRMYLISPSGSSVLLVYHRGGSGDNFSWTVLDDEASVPVAWGKAPFSGSYRPESALSAFDGKNARGTWKLKVEDRYRYNPGTIKSWSLTFEGAATASNQSLAGDREQAAQAGAATTSLAPLSIGAMLALQAPQTPSMTSSLGQVAADQPAAEESGRVATRRVAGGGLNQAFAMLTDRAPSLGMAREHSSAVDELMALIGESKEDRLVEPCAEKVEPLSLARSALRSQRGR